MECLDGFDDGFEAGFDDAGAVGLEGFDLGLIIDLTQGLEICSSQDETYFFCFSKTISKIRVMF